MSIDNAEPALRPWVTAAAELERTVIEGGLCIGCGVCTSLAGSPFRMTFTPDGRYEARLDAAAALELFPVGVCPFADGSPNETELAVPLYGATCRQDAQIGFHLSLRIGHVAKGGYRERGSSGGMGTWIAMALLERGLVDAVVNVYEATGDDGLLFRYMITSDPATLAHGAKSRYYPITLDEVISAMTRSELRYAVVGLPCFIKAVRLRALVDRAFGARISFTIGLVCGHLKTSRFADWIGWQQGILPGRLRSIDFRHKFGAGNAMNYGYALTSRDSGAVVPVRSSKAFFGTPWGYGFFKYPACERCDDVFAETADVTIGDAWIEPFASDPRGTNIVIARHPVVEALLAEAALGGDLVMVDATPQQIAASQASGLRYRREGLSYRLHLADQATIWRPRKRVAPRSFADNPRFASNMWQRLTLMRASHRYMRLALHLKSRAIFRALMYPRIMWYQISSGRLRLALWRIAGAIVATLPQGAQLAIRSAFGYLRGGPGG